MAITVQCPSCSTDFPVDPAKVPEGGVHARCSVCGRVFPVERPSTEAGAAPVDLPDEEDLTATDGPPTDGAGIPDSDISEESEEAGDFIVGPESMEVEAEPLEGLVNEEEMDPTATFSGGEAAVAETSPAEVEPMEGLETPGEDPSGEVPPTLESSDTGPGPAPRTEPPADDDGFNPFLQRDPGQRAARLARVLVSDMIMYNPDRHARALENGSLAEDFEDEIQKSLKEYIEQVGEEVAEESDYFTDALNEILARGEEIF